MSRKHRYRLQGGCHCNNIRVTIELPKPLGEYRPRACDCAFCRKHGASYVSDPQGALRIELEAPQRLGRYRQGNEIAECLFCANCGVLVGICYRENGRLYAAVNSAVLDGAGFGEKIPVSPGALDASDKVRRWKELWFSDVTLLADDA